MAQIKKDTSLRKSILQAAITGQLISNVEGMTESGKQLLDRIIEERNNKLLAEWEETLKKNPKAKKPTLIVSCEIDEDEIPFEIPENWCWCHLGEICNEIKRGKSPRYVDRSNYLAFAQKCNVKTGGIDLSLALYLDEKSIDRYSEVDKLIQGDVVINSTGGGTMGRVGLYETKVPDGIKGVYPDSHVTVIRSIDGINQHFLYYLLKHNQPLLEDCGTGSTNQTELKPSVLANIVIPLPPLAVQNAIVEKLEQVLPLVDAYENAVFQKKELKNTLPDKVKKAILQEAVQGKLVSQIENEEPAIGFINRIKKQKEEMLKSGIIKKEKATTDIEYDESVLPAGWCYVKLGELSSIITKQTGFDYSNTIKPNLSEVFMPNMIPMVQTKNFKGKDFNLDTDYYIFKDIANKFPKILLDSKCMLLSIVGASIGNVGIYDLPDLAMIGGAICKVKLLDDSLYDYIFYFLQSPLGQDEIYKNFKSTAQGTITVHDVREIIVPMPPKQEQKRIVSALEQILPLLEKMGD